MCITANKFPRVRAALCLTPRMAKMARAHNNANLLALGGELITIEDARQVLQAWLAERGRFFVDDMTTGQMNATGSSGPIPELAQAYTPTGRVIPNADPTPIRRLTFLSSPSSNKARIVE